jgi:hypothetical protein
LNLTRDFPTAFRLVVSRDKAHAVRMLEGLETFLKGDPRSRGLWGFSFFEKVSRIPFRQVPWVTLDGEYLPFVKDPILKTPQTGDNPAGQPFDGPQGKPFDDAQGKPFDETQGKTA